MTKLTQHGDVCVLAIEGELNKTTAGQFRQLVDECQQKDARDFIVDFTDCTGVDSAALEMLTQLKRECEERLGMCRLCMLSDTLEKILEMTRLDGELEASTTVEEALAALR